MFEALVDFATIVVGFAIVLSLYAAVTSGAGKLVEKATGKKYKQSTGSDYLGGDGDPMGY